MPTIKSCPAPCVSQPRFELYQLIDGKTYSTKCSALIHANQHGESLYYGGKSGYFLVRVGHGDHSPMYNIEPISGDALATWSAINGLKDCNFKIPVGLGTAMLARMVRDTQKITGTSAEEVLREIVRERPDEIATLLARRLVG